MHNIRWNIITVSYVAIKKMNIQSNLYVSSLVLSLNVIGLLNFPITKCMSDNNLAGEIVENKSFLNQLQSRKLQFLWLRWVIGYITGRGFLISR